MRLESKPDDLCGNCGHEPALHGRSCGHPDTLGCTWRNDSCLCSEFVPPIVARLVEALVRHVDWKSRRFPDGKVTFSLDEVRKDADLLVELGRMTKDGDTYRWKETPREAR